MSKRKVYLRVIKGKSTSFIGSWDPANERVDNYNQQESIGWHILLALQKDADKVEVVIGDMQVDCEKHKVDKPIKKFIRFESDEHRANEWDVVNISSNESIGLIDYYSPWKQFVFTSEPYSVWSIDCLQDIVDFLRELNE